MTTANNSVEYRVSSMVDTGTGAVTVNFSEVINPDNEGLVGLGGFSRTYSPEEAQSFFPGEVYLMTLTKQ